MTIIKEDYYNSVPEKQWEMIFAGLKQIQEGRTKDFDEVCDRLEKKYAQASVRN